MFWWQHRIFGSLWNLLKFSDCNHYYKIQPINIFRINSLINNKLILFKSLNFTTASSINPCKPQVTQVTENLEVDVEQSCYHQMSLKQKKRITFT